jgi:hypothetical protein
LRRNTERPNVEMPSISRGNTCSYKKYTKIMRYVKIIGIRKIYIARRHCLQGSSNIAYTSEHD